MVPDRTPTKPQNVDPQVEDTLRYPQEKIGWKMMTLLTGGGEGVYLTDFGFSERRQNFCWLRFSA